MAADDVVTWSLSASTDNDASLSTLADRSAETLHHGRWPASFCRRDDSSGQARHGAVVSPALIAESHDVTGWRPTSLPRPAVVNYAKRPVATTTTATAGLDSPAATATVNMAPVIRTARGRGERLRRIQIRSTFAHRRSSLSAVGTSFHQPSNSNLLTSATSPSLIMEGTAATGVKQFEYSVQANSTHHHTDNSATAPVAGSVNTFSGISEDVAGLERNGGLVVRRPRRQSGVQSFDKVDQRVSLSDSDGLLDAMTSTSISITSTETPTTRPSTSESVAVPLRASALRYRARGNFAALVDPLHSGRASGTGRSASRNKWRQLATVGDNSTSASPVTEQPSLTSSATSSANISTDYNSVDIKVLHVDINDSVGVTISLPTAKQELNNSSSPLNNSETLTSTLASSGEWNCSKAANTLGLHEAVKLRMSDSAAAVGVYMLSLLFTLVAVWPVISLVFSLYLHSQRSSHFTHRPSLSHVVFGFVAMAAVTRVLYYLAAEYQLLAAVATPGGRRAIYECWFPFIIAAFCVHQRLLYGKTLTGDIGLTSAQHIKCVGLRRDLCVLTPLLCSYLTLVVFLCLLIEFCVVPVVALVVLRLIFALNAVLLSAANIHALATSSGRHIVSQVVLRALFVICAGFSVVDAATLLADDVSLLRQQDANAVDVIALEATHRLSELLISVVLCSSSSSTFSRSHKCVDGEHKEVIGTQIDKKKDLKYTQSSEIATKSSAVRQSWLDRLLGSTLKKSKVVDVGAPPPQMSLGILHAVGWTSTEDPTNVDGLSPLPPPSRMTRSRSMLYNDHGFIRFRQEGDTDGESDARTLDDDEGGPGHARSVPASEYASAESLSFHRGPGTPHWSRPGSPSLAGFRAPSIHLQDSIDRALDRCDIWRVGREQGRLSVEELRRIVQLYADVSDCRRGNHDHQRQAAGTASINYAEV